MAQLAPYHTGMHLGAGFNSYTQELRLDEAVKITLKPSTRRTSEVAAASQPQPSQSRDQVNVDAPSAPRQIQDATPTGAAFDQSSELGKAQAFGSQNAAQKPGVANIKDSKNVKLEENMHDQLTRQADSGYTGPRYRLPPMREDGSEDVNANQSVTFSTRAISNVSDVMDALNVSASTSIKYGTIHGNGSASFVNEDKILDSQLNYLVSVRVNNNDNAEAESMQFQPLDFLIPERVTEVYGDCFIAGFQTGGEFNAIISVDCHDKSRQSAVKEAIDLELATPVPGLSIGAAQGFSKSHSELLRGIEMSISVNWTGGGDLKPEDVPWDLETVIAVANAYPTMVSRAAARISAILRPYTSLASFVKWQYNQYNLWGGKLHDFDQQFPAPTKDQSEEKKLMKEQQALWIDKTLILNWAPVELYTKEMFDAYMQFKKMWKRIAYIMSDTKKWRARLPADILKELGPQRMDSFEVSDTETTAPPPTANRKGTKLSMSIPPSIKEGQVVGQNGLPASGAPNSSATPASARSKEVTPQTPVPRTPHLGPPTRFDTFPQEDPTIKEEWPLDKLNNNREPISLDPKELNEARLICREAMTLITEEAYSLIYHPDLAYAQYIKERKTTRMKRPIYMYPEVLRARLPVFIRNDAATSTRSADPVVLKLKQYDNDDLWANLVGDEPDPHAPSRPFVSLARNETLGRLTLNNPLIGLSIHAYAHSGRYHMLPTWWKESHRGIGGFGFRFEEDKSRAREDGCTQWEGEYQDDYPRFISKISLRNPIKIMKEEEDRSKPKEEHHHRSLPEVFSHAVKPKYDDAEPSSKAERLHKTAYEDVDIQKIEIWWVRGSQRIAGMQFWDGVRALPFGWTQWEGTKPGNMEYEAQYPPREGRWKFVGLCGKSNLLSSKTSQNLRSSISEQLTQLV